MVSLDDELGLSPCPRCQGETTFHCSDDDCRMLRCIDCGSFGMEHARNWLEPRKWDKPA